MAIHDVDLRMFREILRHEPQRPRHVEIVRVDPRHEVGRLPGGLGKTSGDGMALASIRRAFPCSESCAPLLDEFHTAIGRSAVLDDVLKVHAEFAAYTAHASLKGPCLLVAWGDD